MDVRDGAGSRREHVIDKVVGGGVLVCNPVGIMSDKGGVVLDNVVSRQVTVNRVVIS